MKCCLMNSQTAQNHEKLPVQVPQQDSRKSDSTFLVFIFTFQQACWLVRKIFYLGVVCSWEEGWRVGGESFCSSVALQEGSCAGLSALERSSRAVCSSFSCL